MRGWRPDEAELLRLPSKDNVTSVLSTLHFRVLLDVANLPFELAVAVPKSHISVSVGSGDVEQPRAFRDRESAKSLMCRSGTVDLEVRSDD